MPRISLKANIGANRRNINYTEHAVFSNDNTLLYDNIRDPNVSLYCKFCT